MMIVRAVSTSVVKYLDWGCVYMLNYLQNKQS